MKLYIIDDDIITITVGELIAELQKLDPDAYIFTQGCDCTGNIVDVSTESDGTILINRDDYMEEWDGENYVIHSQYKNRIEDRRNV